MDLEINVFAGKVLERTEEMIERIKELPDQLEVEIVTWQVQDMHRQYPNVARVDEFTVETAIWPRSRREQAYKRHGVRGRPTGRGKPIRIKPIRRMRGAPSTRPILRQSLIDQLHDRVNVLVQELIWG